MQIPVRPKGLVRDPVYQQLNERLQGMIRAEESQAGQQFLTEREVRERFGFSRVTANKALSHLVVEGKLEFRNGVGNFVREGGLDHDLQSLRSFTRTAARAGKRPATQILKLESLKAEPADPEVRPALRLGGSEPFYYFERLRLADGQPVILERCQLVTRFCPGLTKAELTGSFYSLLTQKCGLPITAADEAIVAMNLSADDPRLLVCRSARRPGTGARSATRRRSTGAIGVNFAMRWVPPSGHVLPISRSVRRRRSRQKNALLNSRNKP
jgi:GntR family transcriptional regulator